MAKKTAKKTEVVRFLCSEAQKEALRKKADERQMTMSEYLLMVAGLK